MCFVRHGGQHFTRPRVRGTETRATTERRMTDSALARTGYKSKPQCLLVLNVYGKSDFWLLIALKLLATGVHSVYSPKVLHQKIKNANPY